MTSLILSTSNTGFIEHRREAAASNSDALSYRSRLRVDEDTDSREVDYPGDPGGLSSDDDYGNPGDASGDDDGGMYDEVYGGIYGDVYPQWYSGLNQQRQEGLRDYLRSQAAEHRTSHSAKIDLAQVVRREFPLSTIARGTHGELPYGASSKAIRAVEYDPNAPGVHEALYQWDVAPTDSRKKFVIGGLIGALRDEACNSLNPKNLLVATRHVSDRSKAQGTRMQLWDWFNAVRNDAWPNSIDWSWSFVLRVADELASVADAARKFQQSVVVLVIKTPMGKPLRRREAEAVFALAIGRLCESQRTLEPLFEEILSHLAYVNGKDDEGGYYAPYDVAALKEQGRRLVRNEMAYIIWPVDFPHLKRAYDGAGTVQGCLIRMGLPQELCQMIGWLVLMAAGDEDRAEIDFEEFVKKLKSMAHRFRAQWPRRPVYRLKKE